MQNKKPLIFTGAGIAIIIAIIVSMSSGRGKHDSTLIGTDIKAYRVVMGDKATSDAYVSVPFTRKTDDLIYANVLIDLNRDGQIGAYQTAEGATQEEWVVQNMRAKVIEAGNAYSFKLVDRSVDAQKDFPLEAALTKEVLENWTGKVPSGGAVTKMVVSSFEPDDVSELFGGGKADVEGAGPSDDARPTAGPMASTKTKFPDAEKWLKDTTLPTETGGFDGEAIGAEPGGGLPPPGSDFEVFQADVPDMVQGHNECVPTSTSNSLHWLAKRYGFEDRMPADQKATMEELKVDMIWEDAKGGVSTKTDFIPGKVAFTRRHDLPIYTHQIGGELDRDIARKISAELLKGQAVEVVIGFYEQDAAGAWSRHGGHMMTINGGWSAGGNSFLGVHDPGSKQTGRLDIYQEHRGELFYRYGGNYRSFIDRAFAESPTAEWVSTHPPRTAIDTGAGRVEAQDLQDVWFVNALKIGNAWYPTKQFHTFTGPECDRAQHWHANTGTAWGLDLSRSSPLEFNPQTIRSRNAPAVMWTDPSNCGAGKSATVEVRNIMISKTEAGELVGKIVQ